MISELELVLQKHAANFHPVVKFDAANNKLFPLDFTAANKELAAVDIADTNAFAHHISTKLKNENALFGIGGYKENRILYKRSSLFDGTTISINQTAEDRSIHLGIDIWGKAGTPVYMPVGGMVHSFAFNNNFGDYGATIIMLHQLDTITFHTLYGHVSLKDLAPLQQGKYISRGELIGHFGKPAENGHWPPHLHFQIIKDMELKEGDYPGVCTVRDSQRYFQNCPNPDLILGMMK